MTYLVTNNIEVSVQACCICGGPIALTGEQEAHARRTHKDFYCPSGHQQHYFRETEAERLAKQLASEREAALKLSARLKRELAECKQKQMRQRGPHGRFVKGGA